MFLLLWYVFVSFTVAPSSAGSTHKKGVPESAALATQSTVRVRVLVHFVYTAPYRPLFESAKPDNPGGLVRALPFPRGKAPPGRSLWWSSLFDIGKRS